MRTLALATPLLAAALAAGLAAPAEAQEFQLRAGVDVRPLVAFNTKSGDAITIADLGYLGIHVAPGLRIARVLSLELAITPLVPIVGGGDFAVLAAPGVIVDLQLAYLRGSVPIQISSNTRPFFEVAGGLSFLGHGYIGALADFDTDGLLMLGAEVGYKL
jgi:hypothetical protein